MFNILNKRGSFVSYIMVAFALGLEKDFQKIAADDILGRKLQDAGLLTRKRAPKRSVKKKDKKVEG